MPDEASASAREAKNQSFRTEVPDFQGPSQPHGSLSRPLTAESDRPPGLMASIRRSARNAASLDEFVTQLPQSVPDIFELEWKQVSDIPENCIDALAILAYDRKSYTTSDLSEILNIDEVNFRNNITKLQFIEVGQGSQIGYVSEAFKRFAAGQLKYRYQSVHEKLIAHLLRTPSSDEALLEIPRYLNDIGKMEDLLKFLSPNNFTMILERSASLAMVRQKTELGIRAATQLYRDDDLARFGIQLAATRMLSSAEGWRHEIEARLALDDMQGARKLAQSALVCESRFHMLVVIAKVLYEKNKIIDEGINSQISQLYQGIDFLAIGDKAFEIASDLLFIRPDMAMEIVQNVSKTKAAKPESLDWALAKLSLEAEASLEPSHVDSGSDVARSIRQRITDPVAQQFSRTASMLLGRYSADEAWAEAIRIPSAVNRINFLRLWIVKNNNKQNAARISEQTLQLAIGTTSYSLTASVLRDLAMPLVFVDDKNTCQRILSIFDAQRAAAEKIGPTEDYFDFWLSLTKARAAIEHKQALSELIDIYYQSAYIKENSTKAACIARLMAVLPEIDPEHKLEASDKLHSIVESEFVDVVNAILDSSADHIVATSSILRALASRKPQVALKIASQLNSPIRRDEARLIIIRAICNGNLDKQSILTCLSIAEEVKIGEISDAAYEAIIPSIFQHNDASTLDENTIKRTALLVERVNSAQLACQLTSTVYNWLSRNNPSLYESLIGHLKNLLSQFWTRIDTVWSRVDTGFEIAKRIAIVDRAVAHDYISQADTLRREHLLGAGDTATAFFWCIKLIVVSYSGLFAKRLDTPDDEKQLRLLIEKIPGRTTRAAIWADVAFRYYLAKRKDECSNIVTKYVRPIIDSILNDASPGANHVIAQCVPCLYFSSQLSAIEIFKKLPYPYNDYAIHYIKEAILFHSNPFDVYDSTDVQGGIVQYDSLIELLEIAKMASADSVVYFTLAGITDALTSKKNKDRFSRQQHLEIARRIEVIAACFPKPGFITHSGWKVLSLACAAKIKQVDRAVWQDLADQTRKIPNVADRVLVLEMVAARLPNSQSQLRKELIEEAYDEAQTIPVIIDRIMRLRSIAQDCSTIDTSIARKCVTEAMRVAINVEDEDNFAVSERRKLVDFAYKMDPKLAEEIADLGDNDPARVRARLRMTDEIAILKLKKKMADVSPASGAEDNVTNMQSMDAAWRMLAALNSGKVRPLSKEQVREQLRYGAALSLEYSYPTFLLGISSLVRKYAETKEAGAYLRPMFDGLIRSAELAWRVISRTVGATPLLSIDSIIPDSSSIMISPGDRESALKFIDNWLADNLKDTLLICDPFFGPEDLEIIARIQAVAPACEIRILTSLKHQQQIGIANSMSESYIQHWRLKISDAEPPNTEIYVFGSEADNRSPIHDRWMLSEGGGLNIGTSFNSLGSSHCAIDYLPQNVVKARMAEIEKILSRQIKEIGGQRLKYQSFNL